jgi:hypothetical protein
VDDFLPQTTRTTETEHGHEANKLSVRGLVLFASALVALTTAVELILGGVMNGLYTESKSQRSPSLFKEEPESLPAPRLQDNPAGELAAFKQAELSHLNGYGWVEEEKGIAHIPIARAIEILAERGLPKGSGSAAALTPAEAAAPAPRPAAVPHQPEAPASDPARSTPHQPEAPARDSARPVPHQPEAPARDPASPISAGDRQP